MKFKVGDKVRVIHVIGSENNDTFTWVDEMYAALDGSVGTVMSVAKADSHVSVPTYRLEFKENTKASGYWYKEASLVAADKVPTPLPNTIPRVEAETIRVSTTELRDQLAMSAPDVPSWYPRKVLNSEGEVRHYEKEEDRFFRWRYYYADKMMKAREQ